MYRERSYLAQWCSTRKRTKACLLVLSNNQCEITYNYNDESIKLLCHGRTDMHTRGSWRSSQWICIVVLCMRSAVDVIIAQRYSTTEWNIDWFSSSYKKKSLEMLPLSWYSFSDPPILLPLTRPDGYFLYYINLRQKHRKIAITYRCLCIRNMYASCSIHRRACIYLKSVNL